MKRSRNAILLPLFFLVLCLSAGCGSRPGFEGDFAEMPPPDAPESFMTDEEIEEAQERERETKRQRLRELRQEAFDLYVESEQEIDAFGPPQDYLLSSGDRVHIRFSPQKEMNAEYRVRPDGKISFDLIGELPVLGITPSELQGTLDELYAVYLKSSSINVVVDDFGAQRLYVLGEVSRPGMFGLINPTTLTQVITEAGGWKGSARTEDVIIIRKGFDQTPFSFKVNLKEMLKTGEVHSDIVMRNHDIVYIPKGKIASAEDFVDRFFGVIAPPIEAAWKLKLVTDWNQN